MGDLHVGLYQSTYSLKDKKTLKKQKLKTQRDCGRQLPVHDKNNEKKM